MSPLLSSIREILRRERYACQSSRCKNELDFYLETDKGRWQCTASTRAAQFLLTSRLPLRVPEDQREACEAMLERVNERLPAGRFHLDAITGFAAFITGVDAVELQTMPESVLALLKVHSHLANQYLPALVAFCIPGGSQEYVLARAEGRFIYQKDLALARW